MESLGEKLRETRNEKGLSVGQVCRDTNISHGYIEALESENFAVFPGEPYAIGFLKNYSSYLDLDVQKMVSLYKTLRIQEQPVPVEQLLKRPPILPKIIIPAAIILIVCACVLGITALVAKKHRNSAQNASEARAPAEYLMEGSSMERRLYKNDSVLVPLSGSIYKLELINLGEAVTIRAPGGNVVFDLSQEVNIDLDNNGVPELRVTVADFAKNNADMGALLHLYLIDAGFDDTEYGVSYSMNITSTTIIPSSSSAYPFTLQLNFLSYCMFRWEVLNEQDRRGRNQNFFQRADELNIQAQNGIRIWSSNAQAARFQVIGGGRTYPLEIGAAGEVVVADIRWIRDENGAYRLVFIKLES